MFAKLAVISRMIQLGYQTKGKHRHWQSGSTHGSRSALVLNPDNAI
jgi:hypothetical protein